MSGSKTQDREAYFHFVYSHIGQPVVAPIWATAQAHVAASVARLARQPGRLTHFTPSTDREQRRYLRDQYGDTPPRGIGVRQGEFVTIDADEVNRDRRFIATDFLMDCHALILVARDTQGHVQRTLMAHIDAMTDIPAAVPQLIARMPQGSRIEATIIGSPYSFNPYIQSDLLDALGASPRIQRIRQNVDAGNTVAVDTTTGRILTAAPRAERLETAGRIEPSEIPVDIAFSPLGNLGGMDMRQFAYQAFRQGLPIPTLGLTDAWNARDGFTPYDPTTRYINSLIASDDGLTPPELQQIAARLSSELRQQIRLTVNPPANGDPRSRVAVNLANGRELGSFVSPHPACHAGHSEHEYGVAIH